MTKPKLNEFQKQDFTDLLRNGSLRFEACNKLEITVAQVREAYRNDPAFRADVDDALLEATEPVENALYSAAKEGQPWAVKEWLSKRDKERWGDAPKQIQITHELDGTALLSSVEELYAKLEERRAHMGAIDVEVIETAIAELEPARPLTRGGHPYIPNPVKERMKEMRRERKAAGLPMDWRDEKKLESLGLDRFPTADKE